MNGKEAEKLILWYRKSKRTFAWRDTGNPYDVWISEIMLQQTRMGAAQKYFTRFQKELPSVKALAACPDDRLMKLWEGLGYYSRARNLKKSAEICMEKYGGTLPGDYRSLLSLPGIGPYTAGAVASIAFGIPVPAVDGNVLRVLSRLSGSRKDITDPKTKKDYTNDLQIFLNDAAGKSGSHPEEFPAADFNQALMELGEVICLPNGTPLCEKCPLQKNCRAFLDHAADQIPVRSPGRKRRIQERTLLILKDGEKFLFQKRPEKGLLAGLYEFPGEEGFLTKEEAVSAAEKFGTEPLQVLALPDAKHIFTHIEWHMKAWEIRVSSFSKLPDTMKADCRFVTREELQAFAVPSAFRAYTDYYSLKKK